MNIEKRNCPSVLSQKETENDRLVNTTGKKGITTIKNREK